MNELISELEAEIKRLKEELETSRVREQAVEESRSTMLFMMEDLNKATVAVEHGKKEWEATFDAISSPIFIHDGQSRIIRANKAYSEAAGMPFSEIIGKHYYDVFPKMEGPHNICIMPANANGAASEEISVPEADKVFKVRFYTVTDSDGKYAYSVHAMEDITEEKKAAERLKAEMEITTHLLMIAEATSHTQDMDKLMGEVVHCSCRIMGCSICLSYLWDNESKTFRPSQAHGLAPGAASVFRTELLHKDEELIGASMAAKKPIIRRLGKGPSSFSWVSGARAAAIIPLSGKKGCLGLIVGIYKGASAGLKHDDGEFSERDMKVMEGISNQVSIAIEEAKLFKESLDRALDLSRKIETIQVMHEIDKSILSTLESQEILETAIRMIARVISCERVIIALADKERQGFIFAAGFGISFISRDAFVPFGTTSTTEVIETGRPQYIANLKAVTESLPFEKELIKEGFLSHIRVPLLVKDEVIGVLNVGSKRSSAYTPEDLSTVEKLASQIGVALSNARLVYDLEELFIGTVKSLSSAIDAKSPWTAGHSERVTKYALDIGRVIGLSEKELKQLELTSILHDVGKIGTYEAILDKPDRLTAEELEVMRLHPVKGAEILAPIKNLKEMIPAIKHHHEHYNGTGYPDGLKGEEIPFFARIITVADTADAMGADRPYRKGREMDVIIAELKRCSGTQFDPNVVEAFLKTLPQ